MKIHELKIKPEYAYMVMVGVKRFELRKNDRDFQVGDLFHFVVTGKSNDDGLVTSWELAIESYIYKITYVLKDVEEYGLDKDYCIFGFVKLVEENR